MLCTAVSIKLHTVISEVEQGKCVAENSTKNVHACMILHPLILGLKRLLPLLLDRLVNVLCAQLTHVSQLCSSEQVLKLSSCLSGSSAEGRLVERCLYQLHLQDLPDTLKAHQNQG